MNLYITADGRYVGTQAEAKKAGKGWTPETVPTDKEGLIEYLNNMTVTASVQPIGEARPLQEASNEEVRQSNTEEAQREAAIRMTPKNPIAEMKLAKGREVDQIADFIMDSEGWVLGNIVSAALERMSQLNRSISK